jgi:hypothetical protein
VYKPERAGNFPAHLESLLLHLGQVGIMEQTSRLVVSEVLANLAFHH